MAKSDFSVRDVYQLVDSRTAEIMEKFDALEKRVGILEGWRSDLMGKLSVVIAAVVLVVSLATDWIKKQLNLS